jgi:hypothetical protein
MSAEGFKKISLPDATQANGVNQERLHHRPASHTPATTAWHWQEAGKVRLAATPLLALGAGVLGTLFVVNSDTVHTEGAGNESEAARLKVIQEIGSTTSQDGFMSAVRESTCKQLEDMHVVSALWEQIKKGIDTDFNFKTLVFPAQYVNMGTCTAHIKIQVRLPYIFAKTFTEVSPVNDAHRRKMLLSFAELLKTQLTDELTIYGLEGLTDSKAMYNTAAISTRNYRDNPITVIKSSAKGFASDEAAKVGPKSLGTPDPENAELAAKRLREVLELYPDVMKEAGIATNQIEQISKVMVASSEEALVSQAGISDLARIARTATFGKGVRIGNSPAEQAFWLVQAFNTGDQAVQKYLQDSPADGKVFSSLILDNRSVSLNFELKSSFDKKEVRTIFVPWLLLLTLLIPTAKKIKIEAVSTPASASRRMFTPKLKESKDEKSPTFDAVYAGLPRDEAFIGKSNAKQLMDSFVVDELVPTFDSYEYVGYEFLDYKTLIYTAISAAESIRDPYTNQNAAATKENTLKKLTLDIVNMWQRHDGYVRTSVGTDYRRALSYDETSDIVAQAHGVAKYLFAKTEALADSKKNSRNGSLYADDVIAVIQEEARLILKDGGYERIKKVLRN